MILKDQMPGGSAFTARNVFKFSNYNFHFTSVVLAHSAVLVSFY